MLTIIDIACLALGSLLLGLIFMIAIMIPFATLIIVCGAIVSPAALFFLSYVPGVALAAWVIKGAA